MSIRIKNCYLFNNKDFFFQFSSTSIINFDFEKEVITYIINVNISIMHIRNAIAKLIILFKYIKLSYITNFEEKDCYYINLKNVYLAIKIN